MLNCRCIIPCYGWCSTTFLYRFLLWHFEIRQFYACLLAKYSCMPCYVLFCRHLSQWRYCVWDLLINDSSIFMVNCGVNPFPHIDAFWRLCRKQLFENIVTKEEIAQNMQFLLLPQCFPRFVMGYPFNYEDFLSFNKICSKSSAAELSYEGNG